jgi:hypothetical protein
MSKGKTINRKVVKIHLKEQHGEYFPADVIGDIKKHLSPTFIGRRVAKGITEDEEKVLLPKLFGIPDTHPDYHKKVDNFWNSLTRPVKYSTGLELDISTNSDGEPINIEDYIIYKRAQLNPRVASSKDMSRTSTNYWFYIYDEESEKLTTNQHVKKTTEAMQLYTKYSDDLNTIDLLLWMFNDNPHLMDNIEKQNNLFEKAQTYPEQFIDYCKDKDLATKAEILSLLYYQVIRKVGDTYAFIDSVMGDNIDDAVLFYKDPKNSSLVTNMKAQLKAKRKE